MKTNKILYIAAAALCFAGTTSCDHFLDVNPDNRATLNTEAKVVKLLGSAYADVDYGYMTEVMSDNYDYRPSGDDDNRFIQQLYNWVDVTEGDDCSPESVWGGLYMAIANANAALDAIDVLVEKTGWTAVLKEAQAEALLARAFNHFMLVNIFAKHYDPATASADPGVTYMIESEHTLNPKYERNSVAECYEYIEQDLLAALPNVGTSNYTQPKYHFTPSAAYAFAARFYLFYEKWDEAIKYADMVLGDRPQGVLRSYSTLESGTTDFQTITRRYVSKDASNNLLLLSLNTEFGAMIGPYRYMTRYRPSTYNATYETRISSSARTVWGTPSFYSRGRQYTTPLLCTIFYRVPYEFEYTDPVNNIGYAHSVRPEFTTDECLLIRAEAKILKGESYYDDAVNDLNIWVHNISSTTTVLTSASIKTFFDGFGYCTWNAGTPKKHLNPAFEIDDEGSVQEALLQCVLMFRRIEFLHWGNRWFDIKRYGMEIQHRVLNNSGQPQALAGTLTVDDPRRAVQIPLKVITAGYQPNPRAASVDPSAILEPEEF